MLRARVMPCLLLSDDGLVKTVRFEKPRYVGDPVNVINIFNQLEVDELVLLDIDASRAGRPPAFEMIARIAGECTAPLTYGGGVRTLEDIRRIMEIGVEKVVINSRAGEEPDLVRRAAESFGNQALVVSIDVRRGLLGRYQVYTHGGTRALKVDPLRYAQRMAELGAGELLLTSIDRDGTMEGYDLELVRRVCEVVRIPVIACGGAGKRADLSEPIKRAGASAVAAGSLFVYQGPARGVLINYPTRQEIEVITAC